MKLKNMKLIIIALVLIMVLLGFKVLNRPCYGNTKEMIVECIQKNDLFEDGKIEILKVYDFDDDRYVTFLADDEPSIIAFKKNKKGDYEESFVDCDINYDIGEFNVFRDRSPKEAIVFHVKRKSSNVKSLTFKVNDIVYKVAFDKSSLYSQYTILENADDETYEFKWMKTDEGI